MPIGVAYAFDCGLLFDVRYALGARGILKTLSNDDLNNNSVFPLLPVLGSEKNFNHKTKDEKFKLSIFWLVCLVICIVVAVIYGWIDYRFKDVQVSGVIKNLEDGQLLLYGEHDGKVDTIQLDKEGSFVCHFSEKEIPGVYVLCIPQTSTTVFYIYVQELVYGFHMMRCNRT